MLCVNDQMKCMDHHLGNNEELTRADELGLERAMIEDTTVKNCIGHLTEKAD